MLLSERQNVRKQASLAECVSEKKIKIGEYLAKLQARMWLYRVLCAPGQCTAKRRRKCTRQPRVCFNFSKYSNIFPSLSSLMVTTLQNV